MRKSELVAGLKAGKTLCEMLEFRPGQDCEIFKAKEFQDGDEVIYIPDTDLNRIPVDRKIEDPEELEEVAYNCYTGDDFLEQCNGDREKAKQLFQYCDWQHPSSAMAADEEAVFDDEEDE